MKIKVYVIDLETPRWARRAFATALAVGACGGITLGAAAIARAMFTSPPQFDAGAVLHATDMQTVSTDISDLNTRLGTLEAAHITETAGGTYSMGAVFCNATTAPYQGNLGGYLGAKQACQAVTGCSPTASHMCTADELVRTRQLGLAITFTTGNAWYSSAGMSYFPSNSAYMNDCVGWTANGSPTAYNGSAWLASLNCPGADSCAASHPILCCN